MILMRESRPRVAELWFDHDFSVGPVLDVVQLRQWAELPSGELGEQFHTLVVDLLPDLELLQAGLDSGTAYEIRRSSSKDGCQFEALFAPTDAEVQAFIEFYDAFALSKGLKPVPAAQMVARSRAGVLVLSRAITAELVQVWHAYVLEHGRARLLYSASQFRDSTDKSHRALVGRANRGLHWFDMLEFKAKGCREYDFGGWYAGQDDEQLLSINRFKQAFGGSVRVERNATMARTLLGRFYLAYMRWRSR